MFLKFAVAFLGLAWPCNSQASRKGFLSMVSQKLEYTSGHVRRELASYHGGQPDFDVCQLVEVQLGEAFIEGATGKCDCKGNLTDTLSLKCAFDNVCPAGIDEFCANIQVNTTLSGILDENGGFGSDPKMDIRACVQTNVDLLKEMCLGLDFAKPDFFLPSDCSFTYGGKDCHCKIDKSVPCYDFDCSSVVPVELADVIIADTCKKVDMTEGSDVTMFIPALPSVALQIHSPE
jgi:hypothetical protein